MKTLKSSTQLEIINLTSGIEQFHQQWLQERATHSEFENERSVEQMEEWVLMVCNKRRDWANLMEIKEKLKYRTNIK